jgi:hypothetical protein
MRVFSEKLGTSLPSEMCNLSLAELHIETLKHMTDEDWTIQFFMPQLSDKMYQATTKAASITYLNDLIQVGLASCHKKLGHVFIMDHLTNSFTILTILPLGGQSSETITVG